MAGSKSSRRRGHDRRRRRPPALVVLVVIVVVAIVVRAATETVPPLRARPALSGHVTIPGQRPALAWPHEGEAAVEVEGVGSFGTAGSTTPVPIASVAKVMTAYLTLREHPLSAGQKGFTMTVTEEDVAEERRRASVEQSVVAVQAGEQLSERQALLALLLPSGNNIAAMLAVHDAGSVAAFVARMNAEAKALGMSSTTYSDPSGFEHSTVSTAADQLKLAEAAMANGAFAALVDRLEATLPVAGRVFNYNTLVGSEGYVGVKTGSDGVAGGCLVFAKRVKVDGHGLTVLGVVLGQQGKEIIAASIASARRLGNSAAAALAQHTVLPAGTRVLTLHSVDGAHGVVRSTRPLKAIGWPGLQVPLTVSRSGAHTRVAAGQQLARVQLDGLPKSSTAARAASSVSTTLSIGWRLEHIF